MASPLHGGMASAQELEKFLFSSLRLNVYVLSSPRDSVEFVLTQGKGGNEVMSPLSQMTVLPPPRLFSKGKAPQSQCTMVFKV